jgi:hypothetical protein
MIVAFDKNTPVSAAVFCPDMAIKHYQQILKMIRMQGRGERGQQPISSQVQAMIVACSLNGLIRVFRLDYDSRP